MSSAEISAADESHHRSSCNSVISCCKVVNRVVMLCSCWRNVPGGSQSDLCPRMDEDDDGGAREQLPGLNASPDDEDNRH